MSVTLTLSLQHVNYLCQYDVNQVSIKMKERHSMQKNVNLKQYLNANVIQMCVSDTLAVTQLHSEWPKLHGVLAVLSATG